MIKVIVAEDEKLVRKGLVMTTPWEDFECQVVAEAANGREGLEAALRLHPDLVIADIKMPVMDGLEMIQNLSGLIDAEYLITSGFNEFNYAKQALKMGVKDYLLKPIDDDELYQALSRIGEAIRNKKQIRKVCDNLDQVRESKIMLFKEYLLNDEVKVKENYVRAAVEYLKENYREDLKIRRVSDLLKISESYLSRLFRIETGYTFIEYLTLFRLRKAVELLKDKSVKVYEISGLVGYSDSRYFSMLFKKYVGIAPSEFKDGLNRENGRAAPALIGKPISGPQNNLAASPGVAD